VRSIGWLGVRTENAAGMIGLFRDVLGLEVIQSDSTSTRFKLPDGAEVHVYNTRDVDHAFFGQGAVVGLRVESFALARATMLCAGIEFLYPEPQRQDGQAWQHFRGPDGNVYEIIGPDDLDAVARSASSGSTP
jgi:catechol 2,3-dioxygenase-like lactoylglutathione lyase family enzyme